MAGGARARSLLEGAEAIESVGEGEEWNIRELVDEGERKGKKKKKGFGFGLGRKIGE